MKKVNWLLAGVIYVVSWQAGLQLDKQVPCVGKEPANVVCFNTLPQRTERTFKSQEAADAVEAVMKELKAVDVKNEKRLSK